MIVANKIFWIVLFIVEILFASNFAVQSKWGFTIMSVATAAISFYMYQHWCVKTSA